MINVLPKSMIGKSRHGLIEVLPPHGLDRSHDFGASKSQSGGASHCRARYGKSLHTVKHRLKGFEVVSWFSLLCHVGNIHLYGVIASSLNHLPSCPLILHFTNVSDMLCRTEAFVGLSYERQLAANDIEQSETPHKRRSVGFPSLKSISRVLTLSPLNSTYIPCAVPFLLTVPNFLCYWFSEEIPMRLGKYDRTFQRERFNRQRWRSAKIRASTAAENHPFSGKGYSIYTKFTLAFNFLLLVFTAVYACISILQWNTTERQLSIGNRAWVVVEKIDTSEPKIGESLSVVLTILNTGNTPSIKTTVTSRISTKVDSDLLPITEPRNFVVIGPRCEMHHKISTGPLDETTVSALKEHKLPLYFFGFITYDDVFGEHHKTRFCTIRNPDGLFNACTSGNIIE